MTIVAFEGISESTVRFVSSVVPGVEVAVEDEPAEIAVFGPAATRERILARVATATRVVASSVLGNELRPLQLRPVWVTDPLDRDQVARALAGVLRKAKVGTPSGVDVRMQTGERVRALLSLLQAAVLARVQRNPDPGVTTTARNAAGELARELRRLGALDSSDLAFAVAGMFADGSIHVVELAGAVDRLAAEAIALPRGVDRVDVVLVGFEDGSASEVIAELGRNGFGGLAVSDGGTAVAAANGGTRLAVVRMDSDTRPPGWLSELSALGVSVVAVGEPPSLARRSALVASGVDTIVPYGIGGGRLGRIIVQGLRSDQPAVTIVIEPDTAQREELVATLSVRGVDVVSFPSLGDAWPRLREDPGSTIVVTGTVAGLERQVRMLRTDPSLVATEVVARNPPDPVAARAAGCDSIVSTEPELFAALDRIRRRRAGIALRASVVGAISGVELAEAEATFDRVAGVGSVGAFVVDAIDDVITEHDREAGEALRRRVHIALEHIASQVPDGMVLSYGPRDSLLLAPSTGADELVAALEIAQERLRQRPVRIGPGQDLLVSFSAGVAERGRDGAKLEELMSAARRSVRLSERSGGVARVVRVGWLPEDRARGIDVLLVDPDDATASVVAHALGQAGFSFARTSSAEAAERFLTDGIEVGVVISEISLPGLDGFEFIRKLARRNVAQKPNVVVLTRRDSEAETLEAFRAGADDHVSKPFSPAILVQRVRRLHRERA